MKKNLLLAVILSFCLISKIANANSINAKIEILEQKIDNISKSMELSQTPSTPLDKETSDYFTVKIDEQEKIIRNLTGQLEEINHAIYKLNKRLDTINADVEYRFRQINQNKPILEKGNNTPKKAPIEIQKKPAKDVYKEAYNLLKRAEYEKAEKSFIMFIEKYPNTELAGNAQYWLGETYYVRKEYARAAVAFADGYKKYKKGPKGADNLLKLGYSMMNMNKKKEACAAFINFEPEFPNARKTLKNKAKKEIKRMGCK